jgi:SAM-dependent methyltransferase
LSNAIIRSFWALERKAPCLRSLVWRAFYDAVATVFPHRDLPFMNWGYVPATGEADAPLSEGDEPHAGPIRLYFHTLAGLNIEGLDVVEVGSGRGGGAYWIARSLNPRSMTGVELAPRAVRLAQSIHVGVPNLHFIPGDAMALPLENESVDVVINVESCHHYSSMERFLQQAHRVLRPGGHLVLTDYREAKAYPALEEVLVNSAFELTRRRDITDNVIASLVRENDTKEALVRERVPRPLRGVMRTFMGNEGTDVYKAFCERRWLYGSWVLRKSVEQS